MLEQPGKASNVGLEWQLTANRRGLEASTIFCQSAMLRFG